MNYYLVTMPRGHVGIGYEATIQFNIAAQNALKAMKIAQKMGGVKHSKIPLSVKQITEEEFLINKKTNAYVKAMAKLE